MVIHEPEQNCATFFMKKRLDLATIVIEDVKDANPEVDEVDVVFPEEAQTLAQVYSKTKHMEPEHNGNDEPLRTTLMTVKTGSINQEVSVVAVADIVDVEIEE